MIRKLFTPPDFGNDQVNFRARFIHSIAWVLLGLLALSMIPQFINRTPDFTIVVIPGLMAVMALTLYLLRKGYVTLSGFIVVVFTWLGITIQATTAEGVKDVIIVAYIAVGLLASLIINWGAGGLAIIASIAVMWALAYLQQTGSMSPIPQDPMAYARDLTIIFGAIAFLIYFSTKNLREAVQRASQSEEELRTSNQKLQELNQSLEERVFNRTEELEIANQRNEKRAQQFEAIAQVAHTAASSMEMNQLLPQLVEVISQQFRFYHVGIFLLDANREYAVLRAANSEGGKRMLQRGHQLAFGQTGIVGFVSATGKPRIALNVGTDATYFNNPDLPETRSEMALPLRRGEEVIGVLDVQSKETNAFQAEDIEVLSTLADQVTIAIENAHSFEITQQVLKEAQKTSPAYLQESWKVMQSREAHTGYMISGNTLRHLSQPVLSPQIHKAVTSKQTVIEEGERTILAVPVRLRGNIIGVMNIRLTEGHALDPDEIDIAEAVSERLSLAIETALLLKTTQRRAEIERVTSDISGKISSSTQFEAILRTAAEELSRALGGSEVIVQLQSSDPTAPSNEPSMV